MNPTEALKSKLAANQATRIALMAKAVRCQRGSEHWNAYRARVAQLRVEADAMIATLATGEVA